MRPARAAGAVWTIADILDASGGRLLGGVPNAVASGIAIDSRRLRPGEAFVAIRGANYDGHAFAAEAAQRGAACVVVADAAAAGSGPDAGPAVLVDDTTAALGRLARYHRGRMGYPVVAVTGSCGKTTTKDLIGRVLGPDGTILKSFGTQNNHIGVPLTLLGMHPRHEAAVVELGSNHPGEISYLASLAQPTVGVVTNIGPAHLEFFGSMLMVMQEKLSLLDALPPDGTAVLPGDQLDVCLEAPRHLAPGVRVVTFGSTDRCDIQATDIQRTANGMLVRLRDMHGQWSIPLVGSHNVENALAAIATAWALGVPLSLVRERLAMAAPLPLRSEILQCRDVTILNDCYNANPLSFARALETLRGLAARRRIAVVGDMLELGTYSRAAHQAIGRLAAQLGIDRVLAVGEYAECVADGVREARSDGVTIYRTVEELVGALQELLEPGDSVLIKGSRKLNLEHVTQCLLERQTATHPRRLGAAW